MAAQVQIALDPTLEIDAAEMAASWNADAQASRLGRLTVERDAGRTFHDPNALGLVLEVATVVASGVLVNVIHDFLKEKYYHRPPPEVIEVPQPDGRRIIVVRVHQHE